MGLVGGGNATNQFKRRRRRPRRLCWGSPVRGIQLQSSSKDPSALGFEAQGQERGISPDCRIGLNIRKKLEESPRKKISENFKRLGPDR